MGHFRRIVGNTIDGMIPVGSGGTNYDQIIDGHGGFLTPGLIDVHWHTQAGVDESDSFGSYGYVEGDIPAPRIYPSGAIISQTSGHADLGRSATRQRPACGRELLLQGKRKALR